MMNNEFNSKLILYLLAITAVTFIIGLILYLTGFNLFFNYLFFDNEITYAIFSVITTKILVLIFLLIIVSSWYIYDKRFAKNLAIGILSSYYIASFLKDFFQDPRPPTNIKANESGYGFPSGHAQNGVAGWGYMAYEAYRKENKVLFWIFSILLYLLAGSRLVIGVHDLQDVWGGLTIGFMWLIIFIVLEPKVSEKLRGLSILIKTILSVAIPIILFILVMLIFPDSTENYGLISGGLMGLSLGYLLETEKIKYEPGDLTTSQRIINLGIGLIITLVLYFAFSLLFPESPIMDFLQYLVLSFLLVTLVPWIFTKIQRK
ncbi:MAG: phosphatase PAP2 family protein [Promethearchaeota archaeon]|nr:MAG: phosphatase PAP2 family protein [Candidatus Lokiarchaeota archaeon]